MRKLLISNLEDRPVVILGLGYVGMTLAAHLLQQGCKVHGVEVRNEVLDQLSLGKSFFHEPGIDKILSEAIAKDYFTFSRTINKEDVNRNFIITVGTPLNAEMKSDMSNISRVAVEVARFLNDGDLVILRSTVKLGTTLSTVRPILESSSKKFFLAFCPERTLEGNALQELHFLPQIVGGIDLGSTQKAATFFRNYTENVLEVKDSTTAEMIKLVDNMQRDAQFAISNEVAKMCTSLGIRAKDVIEFGKNGYPRTNLPKPGPVGGPCLEKDSLILAESFTKDDFKPLMSLGARATNLSVIENSITYLLRLLNDCELDSPRVALLGMAFKGFPETDDLRGSSSIQFAKEFSDRCSRARIKVWDPVVKNLDLSSLDFEVIDEFENCFQSVDLVILLNNHQSLSAIKFKDLILEYERPILIYDLWDRYEQSEFPGNVMYSGWGNHE